jgi:hypothetical protein
MDSGCAPISSEKSLISLGSWRSSTDSQSRPYLFTIKYDDSTAVACRFSSSASAAISSTIIWLYGIFTAKSLCTPRRRADSGSSVKIATLLPKSCFNPLTKPRRPLPDSWVACQPYSLCISKIRLTARSLWINPASTRRVKKVLPVPVLPNTPLLRSIKPSRSMQIGVSISRGRPIWK